MSAKSITGKRKLSTAVIDNSQPSMVTRRTRSTSVADSVHTYRSTRSTNKNAFYELPHNFGSRKLVQNTESTESLPLKRNKRSSTSSSSNYVAEERASPSPSKKKKKLQNNDVVPLKAVSPGKENLIVTCNGRSNGTENLKESPELRKGKKQDNNCNKTSTKEQISNVSEHNANCSFNNDKEKLKKFNKLLLSGSDTKVCSKIKSNNTLQSYMTKNLPIPLCQLEDFKRKRRFSENEISSSGRIRRLSERGEMASVMEFFFKNKKPLSNSFVSSKKTKHFKKRNLRNSDQKSNMKDQLDCNVVVRMKRTRKSIETSTDDGKSLLLSNCDNDKNDLPHEKKNLQASTKTSAKEKILSDLIKPRVNGVQDENLIKTLLQEVSTSPPNKQGLLKRSLRSSGVKCQPDYYALGLNLMIRRRPRNSSDYGLEKQEEPQVMSDSEIDLNRKSSFESCLNSENKEHPQDSAIEDSYSMQTSEISRNEIKKIENRHGAVSRNSNAKRKNGSRKDERPANSTTKQFLPITEPREPPPLFDEEPPSGPEVYFFESDHVALKHNTDYYSLLRSASVLESQRKQALADLDHLQEYLKKALKDPISFVDQLQKKEQLNLPKNQSVSNLPSIDWSKYTSPFGTFENVFAREPPSKPTTRGKKSSYTTSQKATEQQSTCSNAPKQRSRTFKKSWTVEEQRKLEELLLKYPQEAIEFNRYRKIASELGDRTALQVQSRVQKYFIKLAKAGLPIPGKMPRLDRLISCKPRSVHRHRTHHQSSLTRISTFFSNFHLPVKMADSDADPPDLGEDNDGWEAIQSELVSDEEEVPDELRFSDEYLEILQLKRQRRQQLRVFDRSGRQAIARHTGYQCDICEMEPIEGVRYHCIDCPGADGVDLCQSCIRLQTKFETEVHKSNHRMEPVYASVGYEDGSPFDSIPSTSHPFMDSDYTKVARSSGEYNYLDPNFLPPTG